MTSRLYFRQTSVLLNGNTSSYKLISQTCDGAAVMSSDKSGVHTTIKQSYQCAATHISDIHL